VNRYRDDDYVARFDRLRRLTGDSHYVVEQVINTLGYDTLEGMTVVELGAGTGVMSEQFALGGAAVIGFDASEKMVRFAQNRSRAANCGSLEFHIADHRSLPLPDGHADLVFSSWSINVMAAEALSGWRESIDMLVREVDRVLAAGGRVAFILPDSPAQVPLREYLKQVFGFRAKALSYAWKFRSRAEAREVITFFLGEEAWQMFRTGGAE
jgi:ubiquinone/menaquinone biosynthesis C-methylase UbiE